MVKIPCDPHCAAAQSSDMVKIPCDLHCAAAAQSCQYVFHSQLAICYSMFSENMKWRKLSTGLIKRGKLPSYLPLNRFWEDTTQFPSSPPLFF